MTIFIDDISEPGAWMRAIGRGCLPEASPMCRACGKPLCDHPDPVFCGVLPDQFASDREPYRLGRSGERVAVHIQSDNDIGARHHVA